MAEESSASAEVSAPRTPASFSALPPHIPRRSTLASTPSVLGGVAMSKAETVLLSAMGDILVSRCRESSQAYMVPSHLDSISVKRQQPELDMSWWDANCKGLYTLNQNGTLCPCDGGSTAVDSEYYTTTNGRGLLGGNPPKGGTSDIVDSDVRSKENNPQQTSSVNSLSSTVPVSPKAPKPLGSSDTELLPVPLVPLPSFDYSHFAEGGNDMIPSTPESRLMNSAVARKDESPSLLSSILEMGEQVGVEGLGGSSRTMNGSNKPTPPIQPLLTDATAQIPESSGGGPSPESGSHERLKPRQTTELAPPMVMHGVPTFLSSLPQIRVAQVSANPLGSHVLLISEEALLFSFGLNGHGQLGNGTQSSVTDPNRGFVTTPTLVTPFLENGGKAVACAAGVDHSLVVIKTEGRRVGRLQEKDRIARRRNGHDEKSHLFEITRVTSSPPRIVGAEDSDQEQSPPNSKAALDPDELMCHHQVYGFGRNDCMKLGLVNPEMNGGTAEEEGTEDDVLLPRRVALHCNVWPGTTGQPSAGVFSIAASAHHSAALVRRPTGAVELYTWGLADAGALGPHEAADLVSLVDEADKGKNSSVRRHRLGANTKAGETETKPHLNGERPKHPSRRKVPVPTMVRKLSYLPSFEDAGVAVALGKRGSAEYPVHIALGPTSTFVVTSKGKCVSFGTSQDGLLGHGPGTTAGTEPKRISFPDSRATEIVSVSVGARHVVALAGDGSVYSWGACSGGRLGYGGDPCEPEEEGGNRAPILRQNDIQWTPRRVEIPDVATCSHVLRSRHQRAFSDNGLPDSMFGTEEVPTEGIRNDQIGAVPVVQACAGYDSTVFVTNTGQVLACGEKSGRLGVGEVSSNVCPPKPMFGGLQLWRQDATMKS